MVSTRHDVAIVGGGLVGTSLALALDRIGMDVALIEATPAGALPAVFDERNLSFAEATVNALTALGVMQKLRTPAAPIRRIHVSRQGDFGRVQLDAGDYGREAFGQVVMARAFGEALEARLDEAPRVVRYRPARFLGVDDGGGVARGIRIAGEEGERTIQARLLVGADGTRSAVREALGLDADEHDYAQTLFVARVRSERAPDGTAYERFGDDGPTALLPRADGQFGVVHAVAGKHAAAVAALDASGFIARLQQAFGWRVGRFLSAGDRSTYQAVGLRAPTVLDQRAVLVGNAAQTLHPIGAQGFNLGLRDALTLAELIEGQPDPGTDALLAAYALRRQDDRERTIRFSDGLARLTANTDPLLRPLRAIGLMAADRLPALQGWLVGGAMGYRGDVPRLCRALPT
ncbi:MAG: 2-octaprenyl-6-methoxyphenyl hydroxylase [Xanthomonadaceae bacterium]|nr:2-octaprenyl-6-methoxyphenyl hydroxylase [Xanthomonadaceae bacterium]